MRDRLVGKSEERKFEKGFSFVETSVYMAVIGLVALAAMPNFQAAVVKFDKDRLAANANYTSYPKPLIAPRQDTGGTVTPPVSPPIAVITVKNGKTKKLLGS